MTEAQLVAPVTPAPPVLVSDDKTAVPAGSVRVLKSEDILQGASEIFIQHGPQVYRLRQTKTGKLLLYK